MKDEKDGYWACVRHWKPWGNAPSERNGMGWPCWGSQNQEREGWAFQAPDGANARRIVACVNGCAGVENPEAIGECLRALVHLHRFVSNLAGTTGELRLADQTALIEKAAALMHEFSPETLDARSALALAKLGGRG